VEFVTLKTATVSARQMAHPPHVPGATVLPETWTAARALAGGDQPLGCDSIASMDRRHRPIPARPLQWQPLVSPRQWAILVQALGDHPEILDDLRVVLTQLSPGVRSALVANLMGALASDARPRLAVWSALAITGHEVKLCSAAALGRLHALGEDGPVGPVMRLRRTE
jgi:hypothetical protein